MCLNFQLNYEMVMTMVQCWDLYTMTINGTMYLLTVRSILSMSGCRIILYSGNAMPLNILMLNKTEKFMYVSQSTGNEYAADEIVRL